LFRHFFEYNWVKRRVFWEGVKAEQAAEEQANLMLQKETDVAEEEREEAAADQAGPSGQ
jgi:hypothetical protein